LNKAKTLKKLAYQAIVIGVSAGGLSALQKILPKLPKKFPLAIIVLQHRGTENKHTFGEDGDFLVNYFKELCAMSVIEAEQLQFISPNTIYIAPAGYHLLIEKSYSFSLSVDQPVNYSTPSIDVLFTSASACYKNKLIGLILTGASSDGSQGLSIIKKNGGLSLVQDPSTAEVDFMPKAAIKTHLVDKVIPLNKIAAYLINLIRQGSTNE
jgi:two-component system chemotaxis response regulator CheB